MLPLNLLTLPVGHCVNLQLISFIIFQFHLDVLYLLDCLSSAICLSMKHHQSSSQDSCICFARFFRLSFAGAFWWYLFFGLPMLGTSIRVAFKTLAGCSSLFMHFLQLFQQYLCALSRDHQLRRVQFFKTIFQFQLILTVCSHHVTCTF